jgi:hypothetical protein
MTLLHTVASAIHVGTTLKYMRGSLSSTVGGQAFDLDLGALVAHGVLRMGVLVRNLSTPAFGDAELKMALPRQARVGVAFDGDAIGRAPLVVSVDADVNRVATPNGDRRVVAIGAERWLAGKRLGLRGGARVNTADRKERVATAGASVAVRPGAYLEGHAVFGGDTDDRGWGAGARVTF